MRASRLVSYGVPGLERLAEGWQGQAPPGWDAEDPAPVADTSVRSRYPPSSDMPTKPVAPVSTNLTWAAA